MKKAKILRKLVDKLHELSVALEKMGYGEYRPKEIAEKVSKRKEKPISKVVEEYVDTLTLVRLYADEVAKIINKRAARQ